MCFSRFTASSIALAVASNLLAGCVPQAPNALVGLTPQQIQAATAKAEVPAGFSTVEFKELGDTKRGSVVERLIRATWGETCHPSGMVLRGYLPNGSSQWEVHCLGTILKLDYVVALPERATSNARVLKCYAPTPQVSTCSVVGSANPVSPPS